MFLSREEIRSPSFPPSCALECGTGGRNGSSHPRPESDLRHVGPARQQNKIGGAWVPDAAETHTSYQPPGRLTLFDCLFGVSSLAGHPSSN